MEAGRTDHRFLFEDEIDEIRAGREHSTTEIEVLVDCPMAGEFQYEHFRFGIWDLCDPGRVGERSLCFRIGMLHYGPGDFTTGSRKGFYHGGSVADEFVSLFALAKRRRFRVGPTVRVNENPRRFDFERRVHPALFADAGSLTDAARIIARSASLRPEAKLRFMLAARYYRQALSQVETQSDMAFISLVSAIEAVSGSWTGPGGEPGSLTDSLEALLSKVEDSELRADLKHEFWEFGAVRRKFVGFVLEHVEASFWTDSGRPTEEWKRIEPTDLEKHVRRIYDARSALLHNGTPIPPMAFCDVHGAEICPSLGMQSGQRKWTRSEYLPHISFIERLVNHVLLTFLDRNQCS